MPKFHSNDGDTDSNGEKEVDNQCDNGSTSESIFGPLAPPPTMPFLRSTLSLVRFSILLLMLRLGSFIVGQ